MQASVEQLPQALLPEAQRQRCEVWTRVMGYHRPVAAFNPGKQSEHRERRHFTETTAHCTSA
jgi:anaerobic ribonucleoside-triphosphate reductase